MNKKKLMLFVVFGVILGITLSQIYNIEKNKNIQSLCYTDLQPSAYFTKQSIFFGELTNPIRIDDGKININPLRKYDILKIREIAQTGSMRPTIPDNGYVIILTNTKKEEIRVGDIVSIKRTGKSNLLHRVVEITGEVYITKGDNNNIRDKEEWSFEQINGKVVGVLY